MRKFKIFMNPIKEEAWINAQLEKGYQLISHSSWGVYTFRKTEKKYVTRIDYRSLNKKQYDEYIALHEDCGWQHVYGHKYGTDNQYWQKEKEGQDVLFSDITSQIHYFKRLQTFYLSILLPFFFILFFYLKSGIFHLFLTPGLFDMPFDLMWKAILFELPFALLRLLPLLVLIYIGYLIIKNSIKIKAMEKLIS